MCKQLLCEGDVYIVACDYVYLMMLPYPSTVVISLLDALHSQDQSNKNGYLPQIIENWPVEY